MQYTVVFLPKLFLTTYIKANRKDWLTLNFDKENIKLHFIDQLKISLHFL